MEICRLCLVNHNQILSVFSDFKPNENVANIISKHIGEVSANQLRFGVSIRKKFTFYV